MCAIVFAFLAASGARHLEFSNDYRIFFSKENPQLLAFEHLQNVYTKSDNVLFAISPANGDVFTPDTLEAIRWLTEASWQIPYSIRVDSVTNFQHTYAEADDLVVEDLVPDPSSLDADELEKIRGIATTEPLLVNRLIAPDSRTTGVNVTVQLPGVNPEKEVPEVVAFSRNLATRLLEQYPELEVHLTGVVLLNNAFSEMALSDMKTLVPIMFAVIVLVLLLLLRSLAATFATLLVIILSIITAMGLAGWLGIHITPPMASAPTMIMTLAVANSVHFLVTFLQKVRGGESQRDAMLESLRINLQPIMITSLTTAIGFMSMNFSDAPPFRDLGNVVAIGVVASFLYSMALLPALMLLLPVRHRSGPGRSAPIMDALANLVVERRKSVLLFMAVLVTGLISFVPRNELNDEFVKYFDERVPFRVDTDYVTDHLTGLYSISYSLGAGEPGGISEPAYLRKLDEFANWYREQPEVKHVSTLSDTMKRLNKNLHGDDPAWYRLPDQRELAAQYLLLYEMSLPYGLDLNNQINIDKSATKLDVSLGSLSSNQTIALEARAQQWLEANAPASMQAHGASPAVMFSHIGKRNIHSMLVGTTVALVLISFVLIFALRSVRIGLISIIPNLVPAGMAFGLWGLLVGQVGLALSIVTGMTLGIVVDDTVHFLSKYLRARREEGLSSPDAVRYAFHTVGTALWTTSAVLMAGFLVLVYSPFELNSGMGLLTAITIGFALLADFLLLPTLLMALDKGESDEKTVHTDPSGSVV
ncbi:efflux RND transporter permease subunit [Thiogranum longum]|uniref:efflux RND transporter permease subunit n=1 Tax=Thiogranum longum TaxID=1537524 RepID=UPI001A9D4EB1|nr:MMPL family transporter [Thiogranum longum]